jgi:hypothetical protein
MYNYVQLDKLNQGLRQKDDIHAVITAAPDL